MLTLMRHGEAGWDAPTDESRVLTAHGIAFIQQVVAENAALFGGAKRILVSPYLRTQQTVNTILAELAHQPEVITDDRWTPESEISSAIASLEAHWCDGLLVVTHQPLVGNLVSYLLEGDKLRPEPLLPAHFATLTMEWPAAALAQRVSI